MSPEDHFSNEAFGASLQDASPFCLLPRAAPIPLGRDGLALGYYGFAFQAKRTVETKEKRVTESPDGTIKKEEKKSTEKP